MTSAQRVYAMLGNETLWETAARCHELLSENQVPHAICGGVAVCLHGYQRNTVDIDVLIRAEDGETTRRLLLDAGMQWDADRAEFRSPSGILVQFLLAGDRAGHGSVVRLPNPAEAEIVDTIEGLSVLALPKLIESKLACGEGNTRRTHKDFADVVELIAIHHLDGSFSRFLHKSLRKTFRSLVRRVQGND